MNSHSMPEMRGEPSARTVAIVLWRPASNNRRTRPANSGSACTIAFHDVTAGHRNPRLAPVGDASCRPQSAGSSRLTPASPSRSSSAEPGRR